MSGWLFLVLGISALSLVALGPIYGILPVLPIAYSLPTALSYL